MPNVVYQVLEKIIEDDDLWDVDFNNEVELDAVVAELQRRLSPEQNEVLLGMAIREEIEHPSGNPLVRDAMRELAEMN